MKPDLPALIGILDLAGIGVFALSGALMAVRLRQTLVTAAFFALLTGVGGGSVRDLLIGAPVFWVQDGAVAAVCIVIALLVWMTPERWWQGQLLEWADAVGLAAYAVFGTAKAVAWGVPTVPALLMGVITGCVGGIIRDVLAGAPSIIMRPEIYVTAAALASGLFLLLLWLGVATPVAAVAGAAAGFILRGAAIRWSLALPSYGADRTPEA
ncbi:MAG: TRIC cation channel family protein [Sphingopyxis sp.]|uniref:trimeric intracellular cation channel family protein n=1 Tax=Sphingopyxis sp. TaxID=1908224 RepID=UPI002ABA16B0|nr:TRIC cation channel family protein [Sphingopyxis sp.]MDZ3830270.1 TRIC cation channel family protein [Sphingopyxis sp.]